MVSNWSVCCHFSVKTVLLVCSLIFIEFALWPLPNTVYEHVHSMFCSYSSQSKHEPILVKSRVAHVKRRVSRETRLSLRFMCNRLFRFMYNSTYRSTSWLDLLSLPSFLGLTACTALYRTCVEDIAKKRGIDKDLEIIWRALMDSKIHLSSGTLWPSSAAWCT